MKIKSASAIFQITDLARAIDFYCDVLGFTKEFAYGDPPYYGGVRNDDIVIHLNSSPDSGIPRGGGSVYIFCDEVDAYYAMIRSRGAEVTSPLATWPYGMRDFQIKDPDGNRICFGCEAGEDKDSHPQAV